MSLNLGIPLFKYVPLRSWLFGLISVFTWLASVYILSPIWYVWRVDVSVTSQAAGNSSALFLTAAAQNLLCLKLAEELGVIITNPWVSWFKAASLPAIVSLLVTPYLLYKIFPPETKDTPNAPSIGCREAEAHGSCDKKRMGYDWHNDSCSLPMGFWVS